MSRISVCNVGEVRLKLSPVVGLAGLLGLLALTLTPMFFAPPAADASGADFTNTITFGDIAAGGGAGLVYDRVPSARMAALEALKASAPVPFPFGFAHAPIKPRGVPGVVIFDYDRDGDQDLYVTNGPGRDNSLFENQLVESETLSFVDVGGPAGVGAFDQDSGGAAAADFDNDGDPDLLVLGAPGDNRLFENHGDGTFTDVSATAGLGGGGLLSQSACLGDVNGDGLVDVFVANATDFTSSHTLFVPFHPADQANQLFLNRGGLVFEDVSDSSGIRFQRGVTAGYETYPTLTHACAMADYDLDGDIDIFTADDQAAALEESFGGIDEGVIHVFTNDGTGHFTDLTPEVALDRPGAWMGLTFADFDHNGEMDLFATNLGTYRRNAGGVPREPGGADSRWFLQGSDGVFSDPGIGALGAVPFGWGASAFDYDNDGDTDLIYHGGLDAGFTNWADNPGALLANDGDAAFVYDHQALARSTDHSRRCVQGVAVGDLDGDGFVDVVSVSNHDYPAGAPLMVEPALGSRFDPTAYSWPTWVPAEEEGFFVPNPALPPLPDGTLSVELNGGNGNASVAVEVLGARGLTTDGRVNRDGVGAVVTFRPAGGRPAMRPVVAGSSFASQDSLVSHFGLGAADYGRVEVLFPGGVRVRLDHVEAGERVLIPELTCSYDDASLSEAHFTLCVAADLLELGLAGLLTGSEQLDLLISAVEAFRDYHPQ